MLVCLVPLKGTEEAKHQANFSCFAVFDGQTVGGIVEAYVVVLQCFM